MTVHLVNAAFFFTPLDLVFMAAVGVLLLVIAVAARLVIRAQPRFVAAEIDLEQLEQQPADEPAEHVAAG